jgi:hypothetical protein
MKKVIIVALSAVLAVMAVEPAHAQDQKVLAIIDTAIDSNKISSVIYEACFTDSKTMGCPNKEKFMEGKGSANSPVWPATQIGNLGNVYHGHNMVQAALAVNPDVKIVFVRYADITSTNGAISTQTKSLINAIKWVSDNASKFSIDAVSISQSFVDPRQLSLCSDNTVVTSVDSLNSQNIPTFAATGNNRRSDVVGFPSCVNGVIGVGALASSVKTPTLYNLFDGSTNRGTGLDIVAPGDISIVRYNGTVVKTSATSGATAIASSTYIKTNTSKSFAEFASKLVNVLGYPYISK